MKNETLAKLYHNEVQNMLDRKVAKKLTQEAIKQYNGPIYYTSHHAVLRPSSKSTPCRIVMNPSASYEGHVLNEYRAKGPDLINNLLGVLLRFREGQVAISGDIKKMYHAVKIGEIDQNTHRFLLRNFETDREPDVYVMTSVSFGDKPAGNIATMALRKTAEMGRSKFPEAADVIIRNTYVDDILDSLDEKEEKMKIEIEELIRPG